MNELTTQQFKKYREIIYSECGIKLTEEKRELLKARVSKRLRKLKISHDQYLSLVKNDVSEMTFFMDAISTNHTFFFRESKSFKYMDNGCKDIWCAACSSGEEPYSLAMYCMDMGFQPSILATDISSACLLKGKNAVYSIKAASNLSKHILRSYFQKGRREWEGYIRVKKNIRELVRFERFNLLKDDPPRISFDIIFCRNVMIYFDNQTKEKVINRLFTGLKEGGYFIIGGAESLNGLKHGFAYIEPSVYQKL